MWYLSVYFFVNFLLCVVFRFRCSVFGPGPFCWLALRPSSFRDSAEGEPVVFLASYVVQSLFVSQNPLDTETAFRHSAFAQPLYGVVRAAKAIAEQSRFYDLTRP